MSMCYLCDLCRLKIKNVADGVICQPEWPYTDKKAIDYGRDDPKEICEYFEPKEEE